MPKYAIATALFELFPGFHRGVVIATGITNREGDPETARLLADAVSRVGAIPTQQEEERIAAWEAAYRRVGVDPAKFTPSIRFLHNQIRKGKPPRSINSAVDIMNAISIGWTLPCGGDDLDAVGGDLTLGFAMGDETFAPLFKPTAVENPTPHEIIYCTPQTRRVMCRRWTWRNADFSKLTTATRNLAINVDLMSPPFAPDDLFAPMEKLAQLMHQHCGGETVTHVMSAESPSFEW